MKLLVLCLLLTGCTTVSVTVSVDPVTKAQVCKAEYASLLNDIDAAQYNVCGGSADLVGRKTNAPNLIELLKAYQTLSAAGVKVP